MRPNRKGGGDKKTREQSGRSFRPPAGGVGALQLFFSRHSITIVDDYAWIKDPNWQEVLRDPSILDGDVRKYLESENDYTESLLGHTSALQKRLVKEMRARIKEDDSTVPSPDAPYAYFPKFRAPAP